MPELNTTRFIANLLVILLSAKLFGELAERLKQPAVIGKLVSGLAVWRKDLKRLPIGVGMIPRGEVGLIFAQIGLASGVVDMPLYTALVAMVVVTTFITPPGLKRTFQ